MTVAATETKTALELDVTTDATYNATDDMADLPAPSTAATVTVIEKDAQHESAEAPSDESTASTTSSATWAKTAARSSTATSTTSATGVTVVGASSLETATTAESTHMPTTSTESDVTSKPDTAMGVETNQLSDVKQARLARRKDRTHVKQERVKV
ncbi:uncharacterized protein IUM83_19748 [Phytophthora cinnamomi]|uniref:uncharacterized protein n=1 Tax=Phytophthora cinnamomi TaxID=4785 RepID=UPI00355A5FB1|nr:hypothetical protein IUM83_19748 [Phytophthora cinnamomi]